ncbi:MAG: polysaccharide export protein [Deltaproteobacteria bacterium]|nr:polysaccharide export protein [Deltaproteobacteria bacterium]
MREPVDPVLGVGDEVKVTVWRHDDLTRNLRVGASGLAFYPLIGEVKLLGITPNQLRADLAQGLSRFVNDPQVSVEVVAFRSRRIQVLGEVRQPGVFMMEDSLTVLDAIAMAGGFTLDARTSNVVLARRVEKGIELRALDLQSFLDKGKVDQNVALERGDIVYVVPTIIANVERFMLRFGHIISPVVEVERGWVLGDAIVNIVTGKSTDPAATTLVIEPR